MGAVREGVGSSRQVLPHPATWSAGAPLACQQAAVWTSSLLAPTHLGWQNRQAVWVLESAESDFHSVPHPLSTRQVLTPSFQNHGRSPLNIHARGHRSTANARAAPSLDERGQHLTLWACMPPCGKISPSMPSTSHRRGMPGRLSPSATSASLYPCVCMYSHHSLKQVGQLPPRWHVSDVARKAHHGEVAFGVQGGGLSASKLSSARSGKHPGVRGVFVWGGGRHRRSLRLNGPLHTRPTGSCEAHPFGLGCLE